MAAETKSQSAASATTVAETSLLEQAISAGEHPDKPDQADDLTAHRALLHARVRLLAGTAAPE